MAPAPASGVPAGYGRSCTNCSRAKCRCILRPEGGSCQRCHRLGKPCEQIAASRKRVSRRSATSRTAQLEEKLEDLVSILKAAQGHSKPDLAAALTLSPSQSSSVQPPSQPSSAQLPSQPFPSRLDSLAAAASSQSPSERLLCMEHTPSADVPLAANDARVRPEPTPDEAEIYLAKFRDWLAHFPFMHLPPGLSAGQLRKERPFLWMAIMGVTSMSGPQQHLMRDRIREEVAQRVIFNHERSLDVLLGLLVYLTWATLNNAPGPKPFIVLYAQLAATIIFEMGLTRDPIEDHRTSLYLKICTIRNLPPLKVRSMEERRALLAFWFCTSIFFSFIGKMETLAWTPHMDDCLDILEREQDHSLDEVLVTLVKVQLIGDEAQKLLRRDWTSHAGQGPTYIFKAGLLSRLDAIRQRLPASLLSHHFMQSHIHSVEAQVHSIGLFAGQAIPEAARVSSLYACTKAVRAWYDTFFAVPLLEMPGMPFAVFVDMTYMQATLYRLTTTDDAAWDKEILRTTADLLMLLDKSIDLFCKVNAVYVVTTVDAEGTVFAKGARMLRNLRSSWEPALSRYLGGGMPTPSSQTMGQPAMMPKLLVDNPAENPVVAEMPTMDFGDMTWMTDLLGPWEF